MDTTVTQTLANIERALDRAGIEAMVDIKPLTGSQIVMEMSLTEAVRLAQALGREDEIPRETPQDRLAGVLAAYDEARKEQA